MNVTKSIPPLIFVAESSKEDNPEAFRAFIGMYAAVAGVGTVLILAWLLGL